MCWSHQKQTAVSYSNWPKLLYAIDEQKVSVLANGVDLDYFQPGDEQKPREPATLVVSGKMSYHANVSMVLHLVNNIMPHVWAERPDVRLLVVGKDPTREIQALGEHSAVTVTGTVDHLASLSATRHDSRCSTHIWRRHPKQAH
jgi:polysaccharide biosynthesis protein PslH